MDVGKKGSEKITLAFKATNYAANIETVNPLPVQHMLIIIMHCSLNNRKSQLCTTLQ